MNEMSLDEKIGQMLFIDSRTPIMTEELKNTLETVKPGGFIFFKENFENLDQTLKLVNDIKSTASIPLFLGIDQEGGKVDRLKNLSGTNFKAIPSMAEIGKTNNEEEAKKIGELIASELNTIGLNMDFAPVLDVNYQNNKAIDTRSFGSDPYMVAKMGYSLGQTLNQNNIIPVYKHFPGHGSTTTDSHYYLPIIKKTKEELLQTDIIPFKYAINNGAKVIMVGHLAVPNLTGNNTPASLSKEVITDFLRNELNYQNLIITDALNMGAITKHYSEKEIYEMAINSGVNILLMPTNPVNALKLIKESLNNGTITEEQINNSVQKILSLKLK